MMQWRVYTILLVSFVLTGPLLSQQTSTFSQYVFNRGIINPAYPGSKACSEFIFTDRHQMVGFGGGPALQTLSGYHPVSLDNNTTNGLGVNLMNDRNGAYKALAAELMYAFHFMLNRNNGLMMGLGLSGIFRQETLDERNFSAIPDPIVNRGIERQLRGNAASGILVYNDRLFIGGAVYNLISDIQLNEGRSYLVHAGYTLGNPRKPIKYQPALYIEYNRVMSIGDFTQKLIYKEKYWLGLQFRKNLTTYEASSQNLTLFAGLDTGNWSFGYAFDLGINQLQNHHFGGHLVKVSYQWCRDQFDCPAYF